jgi:hypothetical protein
VGREATLWRTQILKNMIIISTLERGLLCA